MNVKNGALRIVVAGSLLLGGLVSYSDGACDLTCGVTNYFQKKVLEGTDTVDRFFKVDQAGGCRNLWWDQMSANEERKEPTGTTVSRPIYQQIPGVQCTTLCDEFDREMTPAEIELQTLAKWRATCTVPDFSAVSAESMDCYVSTTEITADCVVPAPDPNP